jgi:hypothetical protein
MIMTIDQAGPPAQASGITVAETPAEAQWRGLISDALEISGGDLERGDALAGVPFCITGLKFWRGDYVRGDGTGKNGDVAAIYLMTGPESEFARGIRRGRIEVPLSVEAGEILVFNEAGTGMYRQLVAILENLGYITLPEGPGEGKYGESRYDTPIDEWEYANHPAVAYAAPGAGGRPVADFEVKIYCPRGLRISEYENEHTKQGRTRYIA